MQSIFGPLCNMSRLVTKPTKWLCTQRRLGSAWASAQSDQQSSLCAQWVAKDPSFLHADSEETDLSLGWAHMPFCWFCHEASHMVWIANTINVLDPKSSFYILACGRSWVRSSGPATFFRWDWSWTHFYDHSLQLIQVGQLSVTGERMCTWYWLTTLWSLPAGTVWLG